MAGPNPLKRYDLKFRPGDVRLRADGLPDPKSLEWDPETAKSVVVPKNKPNGPRTDLEKIESVVENSQGLLFLDPTKQLIFQSNEARCELAVNRDRLELLKENAPPFRLRIKVKTRPKKSKGAAVYAEEESEVAVEFPSPCLFVPAYSPEKKLALMLDSTSSAGSRFEHQLRFFRPGGDYDTVRHEKVLITPAPAKSECSFTVDPIEEAGFWLKATRVVVGDLARQPDGTLPATPEEQDQLRRIGEVVLMRDAANGRPAASPDRLSVPVSVKGREAVQVEFKLQVKVDRMNWESDPVQRTVNGEKVKVSLPNVPGNWDATLSYRVVGNEPWMTAGGFYVDFNPKTVPKLPDEALGRTVEIQLLPAAMTTATELTLDIKPPGVDRRDFTVTVSKVGWETTTINITRDKYPELHLALNWKGAKVKLRVRADEQSPQKILAPVDDVNARQGISYARLVLSGSHSRPPSITEPDSVGAEYAVGEGEEYTIGDVSLAPGEIINELLGTVESQILVMMSDLDRVLPTWATDPHADISHDYARAKVGRNRVQEAFRVYARGVLKDYRMLKADDLDNSQADRNARARLFRALAGYSSDQASKYKQFAEWRRASAANAAVTVLGLLLDSVPWLFQKALPLLKQTGKAMFDQLKQVVEEIAELTGRKAALQALITAFRTAQAAVETAKAAWKTLNDEVDQLAKDLATKVAAAARIPQAVAVLRQNAADLATKLGACRDVITDLSSTLPALRANVTKLETEASKLLAEGETLALQRPGLATAQTTAEAELKVAQEALEAAERRLEAATTRAAAIPSMELEVGGLQTAAAEARAAANTLAKEVKDAAQDLAGARARRAELDEIARKARKDATDVRRSSATWPNKDEANTLAAKATELEGIANRAELNAAEQATRVSQKEGAYQTLQGKSGMAGVNATEKEAQLAARQKELAGIRSELDAATVNGTDANAGLTSKKTAHDAAKGELDDLDGKITSNTTAHDLKDGEARAAARDFHEKDGKLAEAKLNESELTRQQTEADQLVKTKEQLENDVTAAQQLVDQKKPLADQAKTNLDTAEAELRTQKAKVAGDGTPPEKQLESVEEQLRAAEQKKTKLDAAEQQAAGAGGRTGLAKWWHWALEKVGAALKYILDFIGQFIAAGDRTMVSFATEFPKQIGFYVFKNSTDRQDLIGNTARQAELTGYGTFESAGGNAPVRDMELKARREMVGQQLEQANKANDQRFRQDFIENVLVSLERAAKDASESKALELDDAAVEARLKRCNNYVLKIGAVANTVAATTLRATDPRFWRSGANSHFGFQDVMTYLGWVEWLLATLVRVAAVFCALTGWGLVAAAGIWEITNVADIVTGLICSLLSIYGDMVMKVEYVIVLSLSPGAYYAGLFKEPDRYPNEAWLDQISWKSILSNMYDGVKDLVGKMGSYMADKAGLDTDYSPPPPSNDTGRSYGRNF